MLDKISTEMYKDLIISYIEKVNELKLLSQIQINNFKMKLPKLKQKNNYQQFKQKVSLTNQKRR